MPFLFILLCLLNERSFVLFNFFFSEFCYSVYNQREPFDCLDLMFV
jgi:hypothetical protein